MNAVTILEIAGEGGGVTILGRREESAGPWTYALVWESDNWLIDEDDEQPGSAETQMPAIPDQDWLSTWSEAISRLDRWPWAMLSPMKVHPDFRDEVLTEVTRRLMQNPSKGTERAMNRWLAACSK